jgi:cobalt/nickel transport system permease protein
MASTQARGVQLAVAGVAAWLSVMAAALATALQLWLSGTSTLEVVLPAMLGVHAIIGIGEGLITVAALGFILRTRPDLLDARPASSGRGWALAGVSVALAVVLFAPLASSDPDGLERVAEDLGFIETATEAPFNILPDYTIPFLGDGPLSTIAAGVAGVLVVVCVALAVASLVRRPARSDGIGQGAR